MGGHLAGDDHPEVRGRVEDRLPVRLFRDLGLRGETGCGLRTARSNGLDESGLEFGVEGLAVVSRMA